MVRSNSGHSREHNPVATARQSAVILAATAFTITGLGLGFIRDHLGQIRALDPSSAVFGSDPLLNACVVVAMQTAVATVFAAVLGRRIQRTALLIFATVCSALSVTPIAWPHLLGGEGEKYVSADSLTTAAELNRAIFLAPSAVTQGFVFETPERALFAPTTRVWTASNGPAKFVSEPLPAGTLPVLRIIFRGSNALPTDVLSLVSETGDRSTLSVTRFAGDRWQFGHVSLPSGSRVRLVVELPANHGLFAFQNPIPIGRGVWIGHTVVKASSWITTFGLILFGGAFVSEWRRRDETVSWISRQLYAANRGARALADLALWRPFRTPVFGMIATGVVFVALAWRQHHFVDAYSVNVMSWDQWDFYRPLFDGRGWWATFTQQHGPHRQGIGFIITRIFAEISGWNSRWDALLVSYFLIAAAALGLALMRHFCGRLTLAWVAVPLLFFNIRQTPEIIVAANLSHGSMPVFLITALGLSWFIERSWLRCAIVCTLTFMLVFTGFGLFIGLLTPLLFAVEGVHAMRSRNRRDFVVAAAGLLAVAATWFAFSRGYKFDPAIGDFRFPYEKPWEYVEFSGLLVSFFLGIPGTSVLAMSIGVAGLTVLGIVCARSGARILRHGSRREPAPAVIFCFSAFTLIFCANTAIGRVMGGLTGALVHRYVTLLIPGGFAVLLYLLSQPATPVRRGLAWLYIAILAAGTTWLHESEWEFSRAERDGRLAWKKAFLSTHSETLADESARFRIYPGSVKERLEFLERHHLNLFNPEGKP